MSHDFSHKEIEPKWQEKWAKTDAFSWKNDTSKEKFYVLEMFPYTSGRLHIGHVRNYSMGDTLARMQRARGFDVLYPMGWDSFGLPAENAAIKHNTHPRTFTEQAKEAMTKAMKRMGLSYDWACEVASYNDDYVEAQQKLFIDFFEAGHIYRDSRFVNWDPVENTVLANEQVVDGKGWRSGAPVIKKRVAQWFFNIRDYADQLIDDLDTLDGWSSSIKAIQKAWIGRSEGTAVTFKLDGAQDKTFDVFTTRADTLYGCTFLAFAPEHPFLDELDYDDETRAGLEKFRDEILSVPIDERADTGLEKKGFFTGHYGINPVNGARVPIYVANYILIDYGSGAIMAVPAHDQRDFDFAKKYDLPIQRVVLGEGQNEADELEEAYTDGGVMVNSDQINGLSVKEAQEKMVEILGQMKAGGKVKQYRLQNWSVSRQRYWGCPVPIVHCDSCGSVPVPKDQLPVRVPDEYVPEGSGTPLSRVEGYINTTCPKCGAAAQRDPDTMDTFFDSAWYFLRYLTPKGDEPVNKELANRMCPADTYIGGVEHATLHLIYARYFVKLLRDMGKLDFDEPFKVLYNQGMVNDEHGQKMSKSVGNVVEPDVVVESVGADATRLYAMFKTSYDAQMDWSNDDLNGARSYLSRVWRLQDQFADALAASNALDAQPQNEADKTLRRIMHQTIAKVTKDIAAFQFNTAIAQCMVLTNALYGKEVKGASPEMISAAYRTLVQVLSPVAPHMAEEIWENLGNEKMLVETAWPQVDESALETDEVEIAVQINGKFIQPIKIATGASQDDVHKRALEEGAIVKKMEGLDTRKVIYVPGRIINIIAN